MSHSRPHAASPLDLFLAGAPNWYKQVILTFLVFNPLVYALGVSPFWVGWAIVFQFIFTLAMTLKCFPLMSGGLLLIEGLLLGLGTTHGMYHEAEKNFAVIALLVFIVAGVNFLKEFLEVVFRWLVLTIKNKILISAVFSLMGAVMSAFLDALTVMSVVITVFIALYDAYNDYRSLNKISDDDELEAFRQFLRSLVMHAAVGTMLGGIFTVVGEPQNTAIAQAMIKNLPTEFVDNWSFLGFIKTMAPITVPTLIAGLITCVIVEVFGWFGYGGNLPNSIRTMFEDDAKRASSQRTSVDVLRLGVQAVCAVLLVFGLIFHVAEVGVLGVFLLVLATTFTGVSGEEEIGQSFTHALPFVALMMVFFGLINIIEAQRLLEPVVTWAMAQDQVLQLLAMYSGSGGTSSVSDNVFVASAFTNAVVAGIQNGTIAPEQAEKLAIAINMGTNIPSIATPNGQAAFLFLLASQLPKRIGLTYGGMVKMAFPYLIVCTPVSLFALVYFI